MNGQQQIPDGNKANKTSIRIGMNRSNDSNVHAHGSTNASITSANCMVMSKTESMKLLKLLTEWNMSYLHQTCVGKNFIRVHCN